jgi:hypothetical protein
VNMSCYLPAHSEYELMFFPGEYELMCHMCVPGD